MTRKRFVCVAEYFPVTSTQIRDTKNNEIYNLENVCDLLNEQQELIDELLEDFDGEMSNIECLMLLIPFGILFILLIGIIIAFLVQLGWIVV